MGWVQLASRKDRHLKRRVFHILPGLAGVAVYLSGAFSITTIGYFSLSCAVVFFGVEFTRLKNKQFNEFICRWGKPFMREDEKNALSGAPFYALGVGLSCLLFHENVAFLSILFLIFGDPLAAFVGVHLWKRVLLAPQDN